MPLSHRRIELLEGPHQYLLIEIQGPTALRIQKGLLDNPEALEDLPDLSDLAGDDPPTDFPLADGVDLFLRAFNAGLLGAASQQPWSCQGQLTLEELDKVQQIKRWQLSLQDLQPGALRVLYNLVQALRPERVRMQSLPGFATGRPVRDLGSVSYPPHAQGLPFSVRRSPDLEQLGLNTVRLVFRQPASEALQAEAIQGLELWAQLLMLGGYQEGEEEETGRLEAAPEPPVLVDPQAIEINFELFNSDLSAINAAINLAHRLHVKRAPLESVELE